MARGGRLAARVARQHCGKLAAQRRGDYKPGGGGGVCIGIGSRCFRNPAAGCRMPKPCLINGQRVPAQCGRGFGGLCPWFSTDQPTGAGHNPMALPGRAARQIAWGAGRGWE